jgi:hypothetical protein
VFVCVSAPRSAGLASPLRHVSTFRHAVVDGWSTRVSGANVQGRAGDRTRSQHMSHRKCLWGRRTQTPSLKLPHWAVSHRPTSQDSSVSPSREKQSNGGSSPTSNWSQSRTCRPGLDMTLFALWCVVAVITRLDVPLQVCQPTVQSKTARWKQGVCVRARACVCVCARGVVCGCVGEWGWVSRNLRMLSPIPHPLMF